jgi:hypothetical protein
VEKSKNIIGSKITIPRLENEALQKRKGKPIERWLVKLLFLWTKL